MQPYKRGIKIIADKNVYENIKFRGERNGFLESY